MVKDKKQSIKKLLIFISTILMLFPIGYTYAELTETSTETTDLTAILYDTTEYSSDSATELTESGSEINNWLFNTSKYLQINPHVPDDDNTYKVIVELPQEFYVVGDELPTPSGYSKIDFTKNETITVNDGSQYSLEKYSGTIEYTMGSSQTSGTIQLEIRYDTVLWDKQANSNITPDGIVPIKVTLEKVDSNSETNSLKTLSLAKVTADTNMEITMSNSLDTPTGTIHGSDYVAKLTDKLVQKLSLSSYSTANSYFENVVIEMTYPSYTDSQGNKHYLSYEEDSLVLPTFAKNTATVTKGESKVTISIPKAYFDASSIRMLSLTYINPTEMLESLEGNSFRFSGGVGKIYTDGKNGSTNKLLSSVNIAAITYDKTLKENIVLTSTAKSVTLIERPDNAVSQLGGFYLENKGTADSSEKTILQEYDTANTGLLKVTTINIHADTVQQYMDIEYTLVDDNNEPVYLNESGERVESTDASAISSWTYSLKNSAYNSTATSNLKNKFTRSMLPEAHRNYYFKTIKYTLSTIKAGTRLYAPSATSNATAAGNFYAYVSKNAANGNKVNHKITVSSADSSIATLTRNFNTTLTSTSNTAYQVTSATMSETSIQAGESLVVNARVQEISYPYGNSTWLKGITLGFILPNGVSINDQAITASFANKTKVTGMTVETPVDIGNGNMLWKIRFSDDTYIGYATENITGFTNSSISSEYINFSVQLDTAYTMNTSTLFVSDMIFVAGYKQTNAASGSYSYASKIDSYDLNENGSTTDKIGGIDVKNTANCQITPHNATLDISDSSTVTNNGIISEEGNEQTIINKEDIITYNLDIGCNSGGQVENFDYYIPIPKSTNLIDDFLLKGPAEDSFSLALQNKALVSGSDIYKIEYNFEEGLNYEKARNNQNWYTSEMIEEQSLNWQDVTMIKLTIVNGIIHNGDESRISINLKYEGSKYEKEAGKTNNWSSGGYFNHINNGREMAGNYNTTGMKVHLKYEQNLEDITLTAAEDMIPKITGNINEIEVYDQLPEFAKEQTFKIEKIETYNVKLQTSQYIKENLDMTSVDANQTFALTVALNDNEEYDLIPEQQTEIGTNSASSKPKLTYKLYNANALNENIQSRYVIVKLVSDNGVTLNQKIIINREITKITEIAPSISPGKSYTPLNDVATTAIISQNASFTAQFSTEYIPELYENQKIVFSKTMPVGTTITLINNRETEKSTYWYYKITEENKSEINLDEFIQMGKTTNSNYTFPQGLETIEEQFIVIVDFANCTTELTEEAYSIKLAFEGIKIDDFNSTSLSFISKTKRNFGISTDKTSINIGETLKVSYNLSQVEGAEPNYFGKKLSLVITTDNKLPLDSYISVDNTKYYLNTENEFIIPLKEVQNGSGSIDLKLISNMLPTSKIDYLTNIKLLVSTTANANLPKFGEIVAEKEVTITNPAKSLPSLKIMSMSERLLELENIQTEKSLTYDYIKASDCYTTIELYRKIGNGYQKLTNALTQVNGSTNHNMGAFDLTSANGSNTVKFRLSSILQSGTYRMNIKVYNADDEKVLEIPYNFIIIN